MYRLLSYLIVFLFSVNLSGQQQVTDFRSKQSVHVPMIPWEIRTVEDTIYYIQRTRQETFVLAVQPDNTVKEVVLQDQYNQIHEYPQIPTKLRAKASSYIGIHRRRGFEVRSTIDETYYQKVEVGDQMQHKYDYVFFEEEIVFSDDKARYKFVDTNGSTDARIYEVDLTSGAVDSFASSYTGIEEIGSAANSNVWVNDQQNLLMLEHFRLGTIDTLARGDLRAISLFHDDEIDLRFVSDDRLFIVRSLDEPELEEIEVDFDVSNVNNFYLRDGLLFLVEIAELTGRPKLLSYDLEMDQVIDEVDLFNFISEDQKYCFRNYQTDQGQFTLLYLTSIITNFAEEIPRFSAGVKAVIRPDMDLHIFRLASERMPEYYSEHLQAFVGMPIERNGNILLDSYDPYTDETQLVLSPTDYQLPNHTFWLTQRLDKKGIDLHIAEQFDYNIYRYDQDLRLDTSFSVSAAIPMSGHTTVKYADDDFVVFTHQDSLFIYDNDELTYVDKQGFTGPASVVNSVLHYAKDVGLTGVGDYLQYNIETKQITPIQIGRKFKRPDRIRNFVINDGDKFSHFALNTMIETPLPFDEVEVKEWFESESRDIAVYPSGVVSVDKESGGDLQEVEVESLGRTVLVNGQYLMCDVLENGQRFLKSYDVENNLAEVLSESADNLWFMLLDYELEVDSILGVVLEDSLATQPEQPYYTNGVQFVPIEGFQLDFCKSRCFQKLYLMSDQELLIQSPDRSSSHAVYNVATKDIKYGVDLGGRSIQRNAFFYHSATNKFGWIYNNSAVTWDPYEMADTMIIGIFDLDTDEWKEDEFQNMSLVNEGTATVIHSLQNEQVVFFTESDKYGEEYAVYNVANEQLDTIVDLNPGAAKMYRSQVWNDYHFTDRLIFLHYLRLLNKQWFIWDGISRTERSHLGLVEENPTTTRSNYIVPYPNPASVTIKMQYDYSNLLVLNQQGKVMLSLSGYTAGQEINTAEWPNGLYYLQGLDTNGMKASGSFMIVR